VIPRIVSADDHVVEPAGVWVDRLPAKYREIGPRVERRPVKDMTFKGGVFAYEMGDSADDGPLADWWLYEDLRWPQTRLSACAGFAPEDVQVVPMVYDEMRPGCYRVPERLEDMDVNHVDASLCFPTFPRFCGQTFLGGRDKDLALLCVRAYNDWMVEEWCGPSGGRLIPLCLIPLWDADLAAAEVRRNAERGVRAVCFSEQPPNLGLPSIHAADRYWDPFVAACSETGTVICMHSGSGSKMPSTSADAPPAVSSSLTHELAEEGLADWLFSGMLVRHPDVKITFSEGQVGWIPYLLCRADRIWEHNRGWADVSNVIPEPPSTYYWNRVYGCFFDDALGLELIDRIGPDQVTFETDYPHADGTWPHTKKIAEQQFGHMDQAVIDKISRDNVIRLFDLALPLAADLRDGRRS
jgi:predicted TIM-barrel fold metal-dependent hydrolase